MKTVRLDWTNPTTRVSGAPLTNFKGTRVAISADGGANYTDLGMVLAPANSHIVPDLADGLWTFRFIWEDDDGRQSMAVEKAWDGDDSAPQIGTDVTVTEI